MIELIGAMTALITPMKDGSVDHDNYAQLIKRQIDNGIDIVVPVGTTGESATLTHEEHRACIETAVRVCKGTNTKVLAGAGSNATAEAVSLAKFAQESGADAVLAVTPYYNKPSQEGLYQHYKAIAQAVDIPVMLYNVPGRTAVDMEADTVIRLFDDFENITSIKEATGSMERCVELLSKRPELIVISGDDAINYPLMANGAKGTISVTANLLPNMVADVIHKALDGDFMGSKKVNDELYTITSAMFCESNPIPVKASMHLAGLMPTLEYRLPLVAPSEASIETLKTAMSNYKIAE
jgi:4-hydroxy-tetrahydrodipicolinate synthase